MRIEQTTIDFVVDDVRPKDVLFLVVKVDGYRISESGGQRRIYRPFQIDFRNVVTNREDDRQRRSHFALAGETVVVQLIPGQTGALVIVTIIAGNFDAPLRANAPLTARIDVDAMMLIVAQLHLFRTRADVTGFRRNVGAVMRAKTQVTANVFGAKSTVHRILVFA